MRERDYAREEIGVCYDAARMSSIAERAAY
jgi:hypothetical protein